MSAPYRHREGSNIWEEGSDGRHSGDEPSAGKAFGIGDEDDDVDRRKGTNAV